LRHIRTLPEEKKIGAWKGNLFCFRKHHV